MFTLLIVKGRIPYQGRKSSFRIYKASLTVQAHRSITAEGLLHSNTSGTAERDMSLQLSFVILNPQLRKHGVGGIALNLGPCVRLSTRTERLHGDFRMRIILIWHWISDARNQH